MDLLIRKETPLDDAAIEAVTVVAFRGAAHTEHTDQATAR
jgi:predicted N-acetyltransferase YhbS